MQAQGTFNVYREQFVRVTAQIITAPMPDFMGGGSFDPAKYVVFNTSQILVWSKIDDTEMGGTHYWYPTVDALIEAIIN